MHNYNINQNNPDNKNKICFWKISTISVCHIIVSIVAFILSWECNQTMAMPMRIITTIISTIFSEIYILYYSIYHVFMGAKCY
jgi:hypothetical protein